jgi:aspartyl-tRNA(Asn)/glutamyl-tRNA(Gln) amidotransferase subunit A
VIVRRSAPGDHRAAAALERATMHRDIFLQLFPARVTQSPSALGLEGPLAGVPFAVKDVFDVRGTRTSAASHARDDAPYAARDAPIVAALVKAGAVPIGKVTLSEFAYSGLGINGRFGTPTVESERSRYLVGGSSSGSAAAVLAGIVPFALATDTSGSTRIPAAWAGTIGFRASQDRYDIHGMIPLSPTLDAVGIIAESASMLLAVDRVIARRPRSADRAHELVVPEGALLDGMDPLIADAFRAAQDRLVRAGWAVSHERVAAIEEARALLDDEITIVERDALDGFARDVDLQRLEPSTRARLESARAGLANSGARLRSEMSRLRASFARELGDRLLITPACLVAAPEVDAISDIESELVHNRRALRLPMTLSYLGCPGVTMPTWEFGRSTGILLSAAADDDDRVLDALPRLAAVLASSLRGRLQATELAGLG